VNFSEARDLFGIIFQIPGAFMKIGGLQVDTQEVQGPFCKVARLKEFLDLIFNGKFRGPSPRCGGLRAAPVHGGQRTPPWRWLTGERPERRPRSWNPTAVEENGGGDGGEPHQLQEGAAEGRTRSGDSGEQPMEEALGGVDVADMGASQ
jgi:hypothetical protein